MREIIIGKNEKNQRFDKFLAKYLNKAPKSFIYKMLRKKNITLNQKKSTGSEIVKINDIVKLFLSDETINKFSVYEVTNTNIKPDVIYEDENIIFMNKPAGLLSQKASIDDISINECLISYMLDKNEITKDELSVFRPSVCNRLDRNTSGLITAGKSLSALQFLSTMFKNRSMDKFYRCIVAGTGLKTTDIEGYLTKDESQNKVTIHSEPDKDREYIKTKYTPIKETKDYTLLEVKLITGKPHQIRAHLSSIGYPIIGDIKYGSQKINQLIKQKYKLKCQLLHSYRLVMPDIADEKFVYLSRREFVAEVPDYFKTIEGDIF